MKHNIQSRERHALTKLIYIEITVFINNVTAKYLQTEWRLPFLSSKNPWIFKSSIKIEGYRSQQPMRDVKIMGEDNGWQMRILLLQYIQMKDVQAFRAENSKLLQVSRISSCKRYSNIWTIVTPSYSITSSISQLFLLALLICLQSVLFQTVFPQAFCASDENIRSFFSNHKLYNIFASTPDWLATGGHLCTNTSA